MCFGLSLLRNGQEPHKAHGQLVFSPPVATRAREHQGEHHSSKLREHSAQPHHSSNLREHFRMAAEQPDALFHIDEDATLYELLGVTPDVGIAEIKQAYKKQALRWHPDKCTEPNAEDVFKRINTAYGVLSEDSKRAEYDHLLSCGSNPYAGGVDSGEHCGAGGAAGAAAAAYEAWQAFLWAEEQERLSRARRERRCLYGMVSLVLWGAAPLLLLWLLAPPWTVLL